MSGIITFTRETFQRKGAEAIKGNAIVHIETPTPAIVMSGKRFVSLINAANEATRGEPLNRRIHMVTLGDDWAKFAKRIAGWSSDIFGVRHGELRIVAMPKWQHDALQKMAAPALATN